MINKNITAIEEYIIEIRNGSNSLKIKKDGTIIFSSEFDKFHFLNQQALHSE